MPSFVVLNAPPDGAPQLWFQPRRLSSSEREAPSEAATAVVPREDVMRAATADTSLLGLVPEDAVQPGGGPVPAAVVAEAEAEVLTPSGEAAAALPGAAVAAFAGAVGCGFRMYCVGA